MRNEKHLWTTSTKDNYLNHLIPDLGAVLYAILGPNHWLLFVVSQGFVEGRTLTYNCLLFIRCDLNGELSHCDSYISHFLVSIYCNYIHSEIQLLVNLLSVHLLYEGCFYLVPSMQFVGDDELVEFKIFRTSFFFLFYSSYLTSELSYFNARIWTLVEKWHIERWYMCNSKYTWFLRNGKIFRKLWKLNRNCCLYRGFELLVLNMSIFRLVLLDV